MNISQKKSREDFNEFLFNSVNLALYKHKFLNNYINACFQGTHQLLETSLANISNQGWILILHGEMLLIYGKDWDESQFHEIREIFDLNQFTNFLIIGEANLIERLVEFYNITNHQIIKRRVFYNALEVKEIDPGPLMIEIGEVSEIDELAHLLQEYYREEYSGQNDQDLEECNDRISSLVFSRELFVLKEKNGNILGFCTVIDPDVGILFIKKSHRRRGYGKILLSYCSRFLLQTNKDVYLMTDKNQDVSNRVAESIGFSPYFEHIRVRMNVR